MNMVPAATDTPPDTTAAIKNDDGDKKGSHGSPQLYTCVMHPEVISDRPGDCPICGMKLVPKENSK